MTDDSLSLWLSLREAADHAARSGALTRLVSERLPREGTVRILDLGTGRGSNIRYLSPRLAGRQEWLVVDRDAALLDEVTAGMRERFDIHVETRCQDLGVLDPELFTKRHLVTASALLDLVSDTWLRLLAERCRASGSVALFALTYNGDSGCSPVEPEDDEIRALLNRHQRQNDKGFGAAAGPDATDSARRAFEDVGYLVQCEASEWQLGTDDVELQRQLIEGWAEAALALAPERAATIHNWLERRLAHVAARRSTIVVCHDDLAAWPASARVD